MEASTSCCWWLEGEATRRIPSTCSHNTPIILDSSSLHSVDNCDPSDPSETNLQEQSTLTTTSLRDMPTAIVETAPPVAVSWPLKPHEPTTAEDETLSCSSSSTEDGNVVQGTTHTQQQPASIAKQRRGDLKLRFGSVHVAWHLMTLGSNPGGSDGPPVELGEVDTHQHFQTVEEYQRNIHPHENVNEEIHRPSQRLTREHRTYICQAAKFNDKQIDRATRMAYITRLSRWRSAREDDAEEFLEEYQREIQKLEHQVQAMEDKMERHVHKEQNKKPTRLWSLFRHRW